MGTFDRFSKDAIQVLVDATRVARQFGSDVLQLEHIVIAFCSTIRIDELFLECGISAMDVPVLSLGQPLDQSVEVLTSNDVRDAVEAAAREAARSGQLIVTPEHLLLGLMLQEHAHVGRWLKQRGVSAQMVRKFVRHLESSLREDPRSRLLQSAARGRSVFRSKVRLTKSHWIQIAGAAIALIGSLATVGVVIWQTRATRAAYTGPWLRFEYFICTGPYNNGTPTFQQLPVHALGPTTTSADFERAPRDFVVRNAVFENIRQIEPDHGLGDAVVTNEPGYDSRGPVTSITLNERDLDALVGVVGPDDVLKWIDTEHKRDRQEVRTKIASYFALFRTNRPTVKTLAAINRLPPWARAVLRANPSYDEPVDLAISFGPHNDAIYGHAYFRSIRTIHVRIQNVSPYVLSNLRLHLERLGREQISLAAPNDPSDTHESAFPMSLLRSGEAVVYPLSISLVPHLEASSSFPGAADHVKERWSEDTLNDTNATILSTVGQQELLLRPSVELQRVTFSIQNESAVLEESRPITNNERLHVSNTCECGSCPLVKVRSREGPWIRTREILTAADAPHRSETFAVAIPGAVEEFMIAENPGETAHVWDLRLEEALPDGTVAVHELQPSRATVTAASPHVINLRRFRNGGAKLRLLGRGYYVMHTAIVCQFVFPLPDRWVDVVAATGLK